MTSVVEFLEKAADYGDAVEFLATGVRRMFLISPSIVRITFVHSDVRDDGKPEQRVSGHIDCDLSQLPAIVALIRQGFATLSEQPSDAASSARGGVTAH